MTQAPTASEILKRGLTGLPAETLKFLIENEDALQKLYDALHAKREGVLAATAALDKRLGEFDSVEALKADLAEREVAYAARLEALNADEAEVERKAAIMQRLGTELTAWLRSDEAAVRLVEAYGSSAPQPEPKEG